MTTVLREELRRRTGLDTFEVEESEPHEDGGDRYAIYSVIPARGFKGGARLERERREIATTSAEGIGTCLVALRAEGEITNNTRVGILDRQERTWIVNPWAKGDAT